MNGLRQALRVAASSLASLPSRWGASLVVVVSMAGVCGVLVALLAMAQGFAYTLQQAGRSDRAIILGQGLDNGMSSSISREQLPIVLDAPGIARDRDGKPLATGLKFMTSVLHQRSDGQENSVILRGVGAQAFKIWPEVKIVAGRPFEAGKRELIAGRGAAWQFAGVEIGREVEMVNGPWLVVGLFEAGGAVYESELWGDVEMVFPGFSITGHFASAAAVLESPAALPTLSDFVTTNPKLRNAVKRETEYYAEQAAGMPGFLRNIGYGVAAIMALGALFAATNTLYAAVRARAREIGTLRALGFGAAPVVAAILCESVVLCLAGAALGAALAYAFFDGAAIATINGQTGGQVAFAFQVGPGLVGQALGLAVGLGLLGGLLPALRAARMPVVDALRA